jgi:hypothetical protein
MRRISVVCAATGIAVTALAATSPAQAAFHLIRWNDTGFCQIWNESIPTRPVWNNYSLIGVSVPTFEDALIAKDGLLHTGHCAF